MKILLLILIIVIFVDSQRWIKKDKQCENIRCPQKFRCQKGLCIKQQKQACKKLCMNHRLSGSIKSIKCKKNIQQECMPTKNVLSCGFTNDGIKKDFTDDCSPCLDKTVKYYFRMQCSDAPIVCKQHQQCINGKCHQLFDKDEDRNRKTCVFSADCKPIQICVASRCVNRQELIYQFAKNKTKYE